MADSDSPHSSIHFPRLGQGAVGGYRSGRGCRLAPPAGRAVLPRRFVDAAGRPVVLRLAGPADLAAAVAMHGRCSPQSLSRRYHGPAGEADGYLRHLLSPRFGHSVAAESGVDGRLVGLGHVLWDGEESEVALLVEDSWQRCGIGTALLRALLGLAAQERRETVYAVTSGSGAGMAAVMRAAGLRLDQHAADGTLVLSARIAVPPPAAALPAGAGG